MYGDLVHENRVLKSSPRRCVSIVDLNVYVCALQKMYFVKFLTFRIITVALKVAFNGLFSRLMGVRDVA